MNRFFTATNLADAYCLPKHVNEQLLAEVAAVEEDDQGEPLFLESHVDAWLTVRYAVTPWRAPTATDVTQPHPKRTTKKAEDQGGFVSVAEAQRRFLNGQMSRKWWYRMAQTGQIAHHRVGETVLFRTEDIERFIAESRRSGRVEVPEVESASSQPVPLTTHRPAKKRPRDPIGGFKFFPRK